MHEEKIIKEKPVDIDNIKTKELFDKAIIKAKMFYAEIEVSKRYQFALASNAVNHNDIVDYATIYTSEKSGTIVTRPLDYDKVWYSQNEIKFQFRDGFMTTCKFGKDRRVYGMIAHNGRTVLPLLYRDLCDIQDTILIGAQANSNKVDILNYDGEAVLQLAGIVRKKASKIRIGHSYCDIIIHEETVETEFPHWKSNNPLFGHPIALYIVKDGVLYRLKDTIEQRSTFIDVSVKTNYPSNDDNYLVVKTDRGEQLITAASLEEKLGYIFGP